MSQRLAVLNREETPLPLAGIRLVKRPPVSVSAASHRFETTHTYSLADATESEVEAHIRALRQPGQLIKHIGCDGTTSKIEFKTLSK